MSIRFLRVLRGESSLFKQRKEFVNGFEIGQHGP